MKNKCIIFLTLIFSYFCLISCEKNYNKPLTYSDAGDNYYIITIDSCEYLIKTKPYYSYFTHKGNCKYCEQRKNKEK